MTRYLTHINNWYKDPFRARPNWAEKTMLLVTIVIVIVYAGQLTEMISGGQQTSDLIEAAHIQARASRRIAMAARRQARASAGFADTANIAVEEFRKAATDSASAAKQAAENAKTSLRISQESFRLDQRAWVGIAGFVVVKYDKDSSPAIDIELFNSGKTPAKFVTESEMYILSSTPISGPTEALIGDLTFIDVGAIPPQGHQTIHIGGSGSPGTPPTQLQSLGNAFLTSKYEDIINSGQFLYWFGEVRYKDIFSDKVHTTQFCLVLADPGKKILGYCSSFNELD